MEDMYYITNEGNMMDLWSFIAYVYFLESLDSEFNFSDWFDDSEFSDMKTYIYLVNLFIK